MGEDKSPYVSQKDKINFELKIRERTDLTDKQKELINLILDKKTKMVFISGPAGCSKTFLAVYCGLLLLNQKRLSDIVYVRTIIESASKSIGSLPGDQHLKMEPFVMPLMDKLEELLCAGDIKRLMGEERIKGIPVNYLRGASLNAQYIILDEHQNYNLSEATTAITRLGEYSKMIILGDPNQSDINGRSAFLPFFNFFNDEQSKQNGIHCFTFTKDDIVRSTILKFIVEKIEELNQQKSDLKLKSQV
jgi:phosphate starvation-inducible PhoH-like protein